MGHSSPKGGAVSLRHGETYQAAELGDVMTPKLSRKCNNRSGSVPGCKLRTKIRCTAVWETAVFLDHVGPIEAALPQTFGTSLHYGIEEIKGDPQVDAPIHHIVVKSMAGERINVDLNKPFQFVVRSSFVFASSNCDWLKQIT